MLEQLGCGRKNIYRPVIIFTQIIVSPKNEAFLDQLHFRGNKKQLHILKDTKVSYTNACLIAL